MERVGTRKGVGEGDDNDDDNDDKDDDYVNGSWGITHPGNG